jgi:antitoxin ParD1/3/4
MLTDELDRFVAKKVKTGRYENASEVVCAGLRTLEREEQQYEASQCPKATSGSYIGGKEGLFTLIAARVPAAEIL